MFISLRSCTEEGLGTKGKAKGGFMAFLYPAGHTRPLTTQSFSLYKVWQGLPEHHYN